MEDGLTGKSPPTEVVSRYPLPCDHCGGRRSIHRDTRTGPVFLQCEGCFCEWSVHLTLSYKGSVCPTRREEVA